MAEWHAVITHAVMRLTVHGGGDGADVSPRQVSLALLLIIDINSFFIIRIYQRECQ